MAALGLGTTPRLPARAGARRTPLTTGAPSRPRLSPRAALPPELLGGDMATAAAQLLLHHAPLAYEPVAAPCSLMNCGDVVYRSTLDPVLRKEVGGPSWQIFALLAAAGVYLFVTPGVLPGFFDYYFASAMQKKRAFDKSDLTLGKKLGSGAFGSVYKATLAPEEPGGAPTEVVVKKAKEFGEAEVWMNERMARASPGVAAEFVGAFEEGEAEAAPPRKAGLLGLPRKKVVDASGADPNVWLVWKVEGENTLWDLMNSKREPGFPYNLEPLLLGRELRLPKGRARRALTLKLAMRQLLEALRDCHATGIVHRDFKPQNCIVSATSRRVKLIDFGAAADLRLGINYVPNEYLLDPRYAPPQQYIMSRQTPRPPPKPVAALLSPVLWAMEAPDRFDMYSAGITLLQLAFPALRNDNALIAFNRKLRDCGWDLNKWRAAEALSKRNGAWPRELEEGFALLEADGGLGWDLATKLVAYNPRDRLTAAAALAHPWLADAPEGARAYSGSTLLRAGSVAESLTTSVGTALSKTAEGIGSNVGTLGRSMEELLPPGLVQDAITASNKGALTEAFLLQEFGDERAPPLPPREARQTIAWWQGRQQEMQRRLDDRRGGKGGSPAGTNAVAGKGANGNGNGKAAANGNGKAVAANGNGNGNGKAAAANGNGNGKRAKAGPPSPEPAAEERPASPAAAADGAAAKVKELLNVFGRR